VVVPARNEESHIVRTLEALLAQDYPSDKVEILVGVAESGDRTAEVVREFSRGDSRIKYFRNPYNLASGARALGAQMASGEIVVFVDAHVFIDNDRLFQNTARLMDEKGVSILSRPQFLDTPDNTFFQRAVSLARKSLIGHGPDSTIYSKEERYVDPASAGASYRKSVFEKVGYFDLGFDACEDVEFNYRCSRAGLRSFSSMDIAVYYYPRASLDELFRQMVRYGIGRFRLARKHPRTFSVGTAIPFLLTTVTPLLGLCALVWPSLRSVFLGVLLAYFGVVCLASMAVSVRHGWRYYAILPAIYMTIHIGLGWGFFRGLVGLFQQTARSAPPARASG
jgi:succinoglycan biosynthesis protein ExoA